MFELWYFFAEDTTSMGVFCLAGDLLVVESPLFSPGWFLVSLVEDVVLVLVWFACEGPRIQMLEIENRDGGDTTVSHSFKTPTAY